MQALRLVLAATLLALGCDNGNEKTAAADKAAKAAPAVPATPPAKAEPAGPAAGTERGPCYGNGTCNDGLECLSNLCVKPNAKAADEDEPPEPETKAPEPEPEVEPPKPTPFDAFYVGTYGLGVNRVNDGKRNAKATIHQEKGRLEIHGAVKKGAYDLTIDGTVQPVSKTEFIVDGKIAGTPNLQFAGTPDTRQETTGKFTFRASKGRKFWRLYEVNGTECVCTDDCGNDFCYIDVGPKKK